MEYYKDNNLEHGSAYLLGEEGPNKKMLKIIKLHRLIKLEKSSLIFLNIEKKKQLVL